MSEINDLVEIELYDYSNLKVYNPEPFVKVEDFTSEEIETITKVLEENSWLEHIEKHRIRKLVKKSNHYMVPYSSNIKDTCRFCSSIQVPILNPLYTCVRCLRLVCTTCFFTIIWDDEEKIICAHCLNNVIVDSRAGKWFSILSEVNSRKRVSSKIYFQQLLKKVKKKSKKNIKEWIPIDDAIYKMEFEEHRELILSKFNQNLSSNESFPLSNFSPLKRSRESSISQSTKSDLFPQTISLSIDYSEKELRFIIYLSNCQNLSPVKEKYPNTYVKFNIEPQCLKNKKKPKSKIIWENSNPIFDETLQIRISQNKIKNGNLIATILSFNKLAKDGILGEVIIPIIQTLQRNKGIILSYKIKPVETPLSNMADKKILIKRLMDTLSKPQNYDKDMSNYFEFDKDLFESDPQLLMKIKCEIIKQSSEINLLLYLDTLSNIQKFLMDSQSLLISAILKDDKENILSMTEKVPIFINSSIESLQINQTLILTNINNDLNLDTVEMQLQFYLNDGSLVAYSYNSITNVLKKIIMEQGIWIPINLKLKKHEVREQTMS